MAKTLIFGATGSIGLAVAERLTQAGKSIHLAGRNEAELTQLASRLSCGATLCDIHDVDSLAQAVADASEDGQLDGVVWAIGSILLKPMARLSAADFADTYYVNVTAAALAIQAAHPALKAAKGSIVMFSSVAASQGFTAHAAIGAAKAGVEGLALALAAEYAPDIRVNVIAPSLSYSKMSQPLLGNEAMAKGIAQMHPLGRLGVPDDFSALAEVLLDNKLGGWITGSVLPVDGGRASVQAPQRAR